MNMLCFYIDEATAERLRTIAAELDHSIEELAESAISTAVDAYFSHRQDDPAKREGVRLHG